MKSERRGKFGERKGKALIFVVLFVAMAFVSIGCASAATIYVPDNHTKIQWAVNNASAGDTIFVYNGTYPEHINISKNNLTIIGENKDSTIIDGGWSRDAIVNVNADFVNISGFTIKSHKKDIWDSHIGILLTYSNNNEITNNSCLNNSICLEESSNNNIIANNTALFDFVGIGLWSSNNNVIANNNVSFHGDYGIILESSSCNNTVISNFASKSCWGIGLRHSSNYNRITNNNLSSNSCGISFYLSSNDNIIANNNIFDNGEGIWLGKSINNDIAFNKILDNHYGISLRDSSNNNIYLNDVINNSNNVCSEASANIWNSTSKITYTYNGKTYTNYLGNYWSDYKEKYPDAEEIDKCGIWNTSYSIDSNADNYPLKEPFENYFAPARNIFDTGAPANPYPSIFGTHNGSITPNQTITVSKLYTYPCSGTGGHTEYTKIYNDSLSIETLPWEGYKGDWHNISFPSSFTLLAGKTYNYTIRTGSYPQIHHNTSLLTTNGWINCTEFEDANGKKYVDWIPAIKLE